MIDHNGVRTTNEDFKGRYMFIYFGFTNCPDICPEELDKMAEVLDTLGKLNIYYIKISSKSLQLALP